MKQEIDTQAWIQAGFNELAINGVGGIRVEVLASRLGVTKGGFYRRFKDRRALLDAILDDWAHGRVVAVERLGERSKDEAPRERIRMVARVYTERVSVQGMAIELAIRQWARTDRAAAAACTRVDEARLRIGAQLYRDLGFGAAEARDRAIYFYSFLFGQSLLFLGIGPRKFASLTAAGTSLLMELPTGSRKTTHHGVPESTIGRMKQT